MIDPDGTSAMRAGGFTVLGAIDAGGGDDGCSCRVAVGSSRSPLAPAGALLLLGALLAWWWRRVT